MSEHGGNSYNDDNLRLHLLSILITLQALSGKTHSGMAMIGGPAIDNQSQKLVLGYDTAAARNE